MPVVIRPSRVHCPPGPWPTALAFLVERFPQQSAEVWAERVQTGKVVGDAGEVITGASPHQPHRMLFYTRDVPDEVDHGWREQVLFVDDHIVVADKPHGMPVTPGGLVLQGCLLVRLQNALRGQMDVQQLQPLHRIDGATAGLVVFGVRVDERAAYHGLFANRAVHKRYLALAAATDAQVQAVVPTRETRIEPDPVHFMRMREVDGRPNATTHFEVLSHRNGIARLALTPVTGKRHQLRVHMAAIGMPLLHDRIYPDMLPPSDAGVAVAPMQLLASELGFADPITGQKRSFTSKFELLQRK